MCARARGLPVNLIATFAGRSEGGNRVERLGVGFARSVRRRRGGVVPSGESEDLMLFMSVGEKPEKGGNEGKTKK